MKKHSEIAWALKGPEIECEYLCACTNYPEFNSAHEGWAVLKEEVDELWDEIRKKQRERSFTRMRKEAIQIAAMAMRFIIDICTDENGNYYE